LAREIDNGARPRPHARTPRELTGQELHAEMKRIGHLLAGDQPKEFSNYIVATNSSTAYLVGSTVQALVQRLVRLPSGILVPASAQLEPAPSDLLGSYVTAQELRMPFGFAYALRWLGMMRRDAVLRGSPHFWPSAKPSTPTRLTWTGNSFRGSSVSRHGPRHWGFCGVAERSLRPRPSSWQPRLLSKSAGRMATRTRSSSSQPSSRSNKDSPRKERIPETTCLPGGTSSVKSCGARHSKAKSVAGGRSPARPARFCDAPLPRANGRAS
jgi:hypothetical protein